MLHALSQRLRSISRTQPSFPSDNELLDFFDHLLQQCTNFTQLPQIHAQITLNGTHKSAFLAARLVSAYARHGLLQNARQVFDETPIEAKSNLLLWNSIVRAYISNGYYEKALKVYFEMRRACVWGDGFTFPLVIKGCTLTGSWKWGRIVHCHALQMGLQNNLHVVNELLRMYGRFGLMELAVHLFDRMCSRSYISWNMMMSGFAHNLDCGGAMEIFRRMQFEGLEPNLVTWTSLLSSHARCGQHKETIDLFREMRMRGIGCSGEALAVVLSVCANGALYHKGRAIHGFVMKDGFREHLIVQNALIGMYGKQRDLHGVRILFSEVEAKNIVSWNALITSYIECGLCDEALEMLSQLEESNGGSNLKPNVVSWSALIDGFAATGRGRESLELFRRMQLANVISNAVTIAIILSICSELAALNTGRETHGHAVRTLMDDNVLVGNSLITMYMKCGSLRQAVSVFEKLENRDLISWNSIIAGYGMHGHGRESLNYFDRMIMAGFKPDEVTFIAIISACSHTGLVDEGRGLYNRMVEEFGIEPQMEHYSCMVDLLGRFGSVQEAIEIVRTMPIEPNDCVWGALLNACRMHRDATDIAEATASSIFRLDTETTGSYMLLSNIYAAGGRWDDSARARVSAKEKGLKKVPGQSWIELKKKVYMFSAGNVSTIESGLEEVYQVVEKLALQMENGEVYMPI